MKLKLRSWMSSTGLRAWNKTVFSARSRCLSSTESTDKKEPHTKRIVLLLPWLGAPPSAVRKYENLYIKRGYEPVVYHAGLRDFLWPKSGLESGLEVLEEIREKMESSQSDDTRIVIHSFSVGCYFYALMLWQMKKNPEQHQAVWNSIRAQVCDSPVVGTLNQMALGVGKMISPKSGMLAKMSKSLCMAYFGLTKSHTVTLYDEMISTFKHKAPKVPSMIVASKIDPMQVPEALEDLCKSWSDNQLVLCKVWDDSGHAQHLRFHPKEYEDLVDQLLSACHKDTSQSYS